MLIECGKFCWPKFFPLPTVKPNSNVDKKVPKKSDGVWIFSVFHIFNTPYNHNNYNHIISFPSSFGFASGSE